MPIESPINGIADLDETNPPGTDNVSEADDHLRLIKEAIKDSFPDFTTSDQIYTGAASTIASRTAAVTVTGNWVFNNTLTQFQTPINLADGTAGAPSLTFSNETTKDSGFYRIGEGILGFSINGTEILRIDAAGIDVTGAITATGDITAFN